MRIIFYITLFFSVLSFGFSICQNLSEVSIEKIDSFFEKNAIYSLSLYSKAGEKINQGYYVKSDSLDKRNEYFYKNYRPVGEQKYYGDVELSLNFNANSQLHGKRTINRKNISLQIDTFYNGELHGIQNYYQDNCLLYCNSFKNGKLNGKSIEYFYEADTLWGFQITDYKDNLRNGSSILYDRDGVMREYWEYNNDTANGVHIEYHDHSNKIKYRCTYLDGKKEGEFLYWYSEGYYTKGFYKNNLYHGRYEKYEANKISYLINYDEGLPHGEQKQYCNDLLIISGNWIHGKEEGEWLTIYTDHNCNEISRETKVFQKGKVVSVKSNRK